MSSRHSPNIDLYLISEEIEDFPAVKTAEMRGGGLVVDTANQAFYIFDSSGPYEQIEEIPESPDRVLGTVQNGFLEFQEEDILLYELGDAHEYGELLRQVLTGEAVHTELESEEASETLSEAGYAHGFTPESIAEILTGWAITSDDDSVLDIATGSGSLLKQAATDLDTGSRLTGVEIHPFLAKLAKSRLRGIEDNEIINQDFFDWRAPEQLELGEETQEDNSADRYDAVVGNPPIAGFLPPEQREKISGWIEGRSPSLAAAFVAKAVTHLKDDGRGAFILPKKALKDGLLEQLTESCGIHRIVELPLGPFANASVKLVVLTLVKEERDSQVKETGIGRFNQIELPDNARGLFQQPLDAILKNRYNPYDAELVKASHADLEGRNVLRILSNPSIYDIITSEGFTKLGDLSGVEIGSGVSTGNNDLFYFNSSEKEESGIDERFFRPVIKNPPGDIRSISENVIDLYLLDLTRYVEALRSAGVEVKEEKVLEELESDGYTELLEYLEGTPLYHRGDGLSFTPNYLGKFQNPDLIIPEFFDEPVCYSVELKDVVFDSTVIGVKVDGEQRRDALARLLNTPLYREFFHTYAESMDLNWYRINITTQLKEIPVIEQALNEDTFERLEPFFPPEDDNDLVNLNHLLIESCETEKEKQALRRYLASRDNFAWSWFLTLPEFDEFQELLESDREQAQEFVVDQFDQELLDQARQTFRNVEFFEGRRDLLDDLLMEFEEGHYRGFLAGIVLQFEGVLADLVVEAGGEIVEEDGKTEFKMPGTNRSQKRKNLDNLISQFFDGAFSEYLHETVRQRRNKIAHGDVIEDSRTLSIHFFVSFYALCNACLNEYVRIAQQQDQQQRSDLDLPIA